MTVWRHLVKGDHGTSGRNWDSNLKLHMEGSCVGQTMGCCPFQMTAAMVLYLRILYRKCLGQNFHAQHGAAQSKAADRKPVAK